MRSTSLGLQAFYVSTEVFQQRRSLTCRRAPSIRVQDSPFGVCEFSETAEKFISPKRRAATQTQLATAAENGSGFEYRKSNMKSLWIVAASFGG